MPEGTILHFDKLLLMEIAIYMFNVLLLVGILGFILYKPVKKFLSQRQARIAGDISSAQQSREEAEALKAEYERMIAGIGEERDNILSQAQKRAVERSDELLFEAKREIDILHSRAAAELELERKNALNDMKEQMIEISTLMAGRFVQVSMDRPTQDKYIDEAFAEWMEDQ